MRGTGIAVADWKKLRLRAGDEYFRLVDGNGEVLYALRRFMVPSILRVDGARVLQAAAASDDSIQNLIDAKNDTSLLTSIHVKKVATELKRLSTLDAKSAAAADIAMRSALLLEANAWPRSPSIPALPQSPLSSQGSGSAPSEPSVLAARAEALVAANSTARLGYTEMAIGFSSMDFAVHFYRPSADTLYHAHPVCGMAVLQSTKKTPFYVCYSPDGGDDSMFHWSYFVLLPSAAVLLGTFTAIPRAPLGAVGGSSDGSETKEAKDARLAAAAAAAGKAKDVAEATAAIAKATAEVEEKRKQIAATAAAARIASLKAAKESKGPFLEICGIGKCVYSGQTAVTNEWSSYSSIIRCDSDKKQELVQQLELYADYSVSPPTQRKPRSGARRLRGCAPTVKTLVGLFMRQPRSGTAAPDGDGEGRCDGEGKGERTHAVGKLHVFAIESGARTAKPLAISSILAQLPPSENAERLRRMREYGDAFNTAHRIRLAAKPLPSPSPPRGTCTHAAVSFFA